MALTDDRERRDAIRVDQAHGETEIADDRLSLQQERLWYLERLEGGLPAYNLSGAFELLGPLDEAFLETALRSFVERHSELALTVYEADGKPYADRASSPHFELRKKGLEEVVGALGSDADLRNWLADEAGRVLPLDHAPLIRFTLIRCAPHRHILFLLTHHLVWDGTSFDLFLRDVGEFYAALVEGRSPRLPELSGNLGRFVSWQKGRISGDRLAEATSFWDRVLGDTPPALDIATDRVRPTLMTYAGDRVSLKIGGPLLAGLRALAGKEGATTSQLLLAAFKVLLFRYSGQPDLLVGSPVDARVLPEVEEMVGFLVNTLVVRSTPSPDLSFRDYLRQVRDRSVEASNFQDTPFDWLVQNYATRDPSRTPLFQASFTYQQTKGRSAKWGPIKLSPYPWGARVALTDLSVWAHEYESDLEGGFDYRTDLFDRGTVESMASALITLLKGAVENPSRSLAEIALLTPEQIRAETVERAGPSAPKLMGITYLEAIERWAHEDPNREAVRGEKGGALTFGEVWDRSRRIAGAIVNQGVGPGTVVGLRVARSEKLLPLILGIHRAGCVYLPLDPEFPDARLVHALRTSGAKLILGDPWTASDELGLPRIAPDEAFDYPADWGGAVSSISSESSAYLMFTSGSTGDPKGVEIEHGALANLLGAMAAILGTGAHDSWVAITTTSFDISLLELLLPSFTGGRVTIAAPGTGRDPRALARLLAAAEATSVQATPATWQMLLADGWSGQLKRILSGGDALGSELARRLLPRGEEVWNLYGPTETTIWSTAERVGDIEEGVHLGRPLHNTLIYLLDDARNPVPAGNRGEIWIGGGGVARGYRNAPELTSARFVPDPFRQQGRMYRTGDLGRWRRDGRLEYLGRSDLQAKVQGFRIELQEVEAALVALEGIRDAVVVTRGSPDNLRLVAYVLVDPGFGLLAREIRERLGERLPGYMIPGIVTTLEALPLTASGKVDRKALPDPFLRKTDGREHEPPKGDREELVAEVWRGLLGVEQVSRGDNFFELGGHSLQSIQAVAEIERRSGLRIDPREFFFSTLAQLAGGRSATAKSSRG